MRVAEALARRVLEGADLESPQPPGPTAGNLLVHAGVAEPRIGRAKEVHRRVDARLRQPARAGLGDARQIGEAQPLEHRDEVRVVDAAKAIVLVEVRGLLGHPDRRRDANRGGDAFTDLRADRSLHREAYALRSELLQVRS